MKALVKRAGVATLLGLFGLFLLAPEVRASGECGHYITSGSQDQPITGELKGQRMVTTTTTQRFQSGVTAKLIGGSYSLERTTTTVYWVGVYELSDGSTQELRCDSYTAV